MNTNDAFIRQLKEMSGLPETIFQQMMDHGTSLAIPAGTILNQAIWLNDRNYLLQEGVVREFYVDKKGKEHTMRFVQGPAIIAPSWTDHFIQSKTIITSQSLTPLTGIYWSLEIVNNLLRQYPKHSKFLISRVVLELKEKNLKVLRKHNFSARERYLLFLKEFPGLVNQISLKHIASYLNITPATISRIRAEIPLHSKSKK